MPGGSGRSSNPGRDDFLHRAHRHTRAHETRRRHPGALRPDQAAFVGLRGRAHQSRSLDLVPRERRPQRCPIVDTWWQTETGAIMISPLPGSTAAKPGSCTQPLPGIDADHRRRAGQGSGGRGRGRIPRHPQALAVDASHDLGRQRTLSHDLLGGIPESFLRRGRFRASRQGRLLLDHGAHRRRAERRRSSARHHGNRIRAGGSSEGGRGRRGGQAARDQG